MKIHHLKVHPQFYGALRRGDKTFEIRFNDRDFHTGDVLILEEFDPSDEQYTGQCVVRQVTYITDFKQEPKYIVMGIKPI